MDRSNRIRSAVGFAAAGLITAITLSLATSVTEAQQLLAQQLPTPPSPKAVPTTPPAPLPPQSLPGEPNPPATAQPLPGPIGVSRPDDVFGRTPPVAAGANRAPQDPGYLGVVTDDREERGAGVRVMDLETGGPADKAGLKQGDLITSVNGRAVHTENDMIPVLQQLGAGSKVSFGVDRNGQRSTVDVTLGTRPPAGQRRYEKFGRIAESLPEPNSGALGAENAAPGPNGALGAMPPESPLPGTVAPGATAPGALHNAQPSPPPPALYAPEPRVQLESPILRSMAPSHRMLLGVRTQPVTEENAQRLGLHSASGALVVSRTLLSPAAKAGIPLGAVITAVDGKAVLSPPDLSSFITQAGSGREVEITYWYKDAEKRAKVRLADDAPLQGGSLSGGSAGGQAAASPIPAPPSPQAGSFPVPDDKARIGALEQRVERLEHRIDDLERQLRRTQ